jgi:hypothetical protein
MPATTARVNITQRRSRGKAKDEGDTAPSASLLARKSRSREEDRRYSIESAQGEIDGERQHWRSATARHKPAVFTGGAYPQSTLPVMNPESGFEDQDCREIIRLCIQRALTWDQDQMSKERHGLSASLIRRLKEYIPSIRSNPALHQSLTQLWYERQDAMRGLFLSL